MSVEAIGIRHYPKLEIHLLSIRERKKKGTRRDEEVEEYGSRSF